MGVKGDFVMTVLEEAEPAVVEVRRRWPDEARVASSLEVPAAMSRSVDEGVQDYVRKFADKRSVWERKALEDKMNADLEALETRYRQVNSMGVEGATVMDVVAEASGLISASRLRWPDEKKHQEELRDLERRFKEKREV